MTSAERAARWRAAHPDAQRAWYLAHQESERAKARIYAAEHAEERRAYNATYVRASRAKSRDQWKIRVRLSDNERLERRRLAKKKYKQAHPEMARDYVKRRRARHSRLPVEPFTAREIFERDNWFCGICGMHVLAQVATVDHIVPLARGGGHVRSNVQTAHARCNAVKGARLMAELAEATP